MLLNIIGEKGLISNSNYLYYCIIILNIIILLDHLLIITRSGMNDIKQKQELKTMQSERYANKLVYPTPSIGGMIASV